MRATGNINVGKICATMGGGGHAKAAGCTVFGTFEEVKEKLIKTAGEYL
jgi:phosphoesterase RecJ-like protein